MILTALKHGTPTTQRFWCCDTSDTGGITRVYVDGVAHDGPTLTASTDYTGVLELSVAPGTHTYSVEVVGIGTSDTIEWKTVPAEGEDFDFAWGGDSLFDAWSFGELADVDVRAFIHLGDWEYLDSSWSALGCGDPSGLSTYNDWLLWYRCLQRNTLALEKNKRSLIARVPSWLQWNDHEVKNDRVGIGNFGAGGDDRLNAAYQAFDEYQGAGRPAATGIVDTEPSPPTYYTFHVGDVEFILWDVVIYAWSKLVDTVGHDKQPAWIQSKIDASTAKFLILASPNVVHPDGFWPDLFSHIDAKDQTIVCLTADAHGQYYQVVEGALLPNRPMVEILNTPMHQVMFLTPGSEGLWDTNPNDHTVRQDRGTIPWQRYGICRVRPKGTAEFPFSHIEFRLMECGRGVRARCVIREGERLPTLPTSQPAMAL